MKRASSGLIRDPPTWTNRSEVGSTGSHSHACAHTLARAFTSPVTVIRCLSINANAFSGLGSAVNTVGAPTVIEPSSPGQPSGKLCPAGNATR